jgi:hypothetical protein
MVGGAMLYLGRVDEAIRLMEIERRFDPHIGSGD